MNIVPTENQSDMNCACQESTKRILMEAEVFHSFLVIVLQKYQKEAQATLVVIELAEVSVVVGRVHSLCFWRGGKDFEGRCQGSRIGFRVTRAAASARQCLNGAESFRFPEFKQKKDVEFRFRVVERIAGIRMCAFGIPMP